MSALRPLLLLSIILTASGVASEQLGPIVGPVEYNGYLVFDYPEGDNPITNIVFDVDPWISECLIIVNVPAPWAYTYSDPVLTLSGGSLNPGDSVSVTVSLDDYFEEGEYQVKSVGTTSAGEESNAIGPLLVGDLYLLRVISLANTYQTPLLGSVIGLIALELMLWQRNRPFRDIIPPVKEVNDFVRESEKILNKEVSNTKVPKQKLDPDSDHKSVIPELSLNNGSSSKDSPKVESPNETELYKSIPEWNKVKTPDNIAKVLGDSFGSDSKHSAVDPPDPSELSANQSKLDAPDMADGDLSGPDDLHKPENDYDEGKLPGLDESDLPGLDDTPDLELEYDDSDLPGLDDIPDSSEHDNSDLPGLEKPTTDPSSPESDNSDLPGLEKTESEPTDRALDDDLPDWIDNPPETEPVPEPSEADLKELEEIRAREKKLPRLKPDEEVKG